MKENNRKCVKCGISPADDADTKLFRFPKPGSTNGLRCELWAKYCFPDKPWSSEDFQGKLYSEHRMLCHRHFKKTAFVDYLSKKLRRFASPDAEVSLDQTLDSVVLPEAPAEEPVVPEPKNFTWQKPNEVVPVLADDDSTDEVVDNLSMYCDDGDQALLLSEQLDGNNEGERVATGLAASGQERRDETVDLSAHEVFRCNVCDATIGGFRYTCVQCSDLDLCGACEAARAHHHHYVLRVPADRHAAEVQLVLATIRRNLMRRLDPITQHDQDQDDAISLKSEVKSEEEDDDNNVDDDSNEGDNECNGTNQSPEDDVLNKSTSPGLPQHGDSYQDGDAHAVDSGNEAPRRECGKAQRKRNTTKIYLKLADFMALKESQLSRVQMLNSNETTSVGMPNAQQQDEEAVVLSGTVAADSRSRVEHASAHSQFKKRCLSSDFSPDTRPYPHNTHHVVRDYTVRMSTISDAAMNVRQTLSQPRDSSDEHNT